MPIGENAIKRVENNGYSKVNTSCPDMENSTAELPAPVPERTEPKKSALAEKKKVSVSSQKDGFVRVSFGQELPYWLL